MNWITSKNKIQRLDFYIGIVGMLMIIPLMLLTTIDVVIRLFSNNIPGAIELSEFLLVIIVCLSVAFTQQEKGHPKITFITDRFPPRIKLVTEIITAVLGIFIIIVLIWGAWELALKMGNIVSDVLKIHQFPFRFLVVVGGIFFLLEQIIDLSNLWKSYRTQ